MNLPLGSRVIIDRTNEPNHAPGELVLLVEAPGLEIEARHNELSGDYILHGSVVRVCFGVVFLAWLVIIINRRVRQLVRKLVQENLDYFVARKIRFDENDYHAAAAPEPRCDERLAE